MEGTNNIGVSYPLAVNNNVVTVVSATLWANLLIVLAVAGATRIKSACAFVTCST